VGGAGFPSLPTFGAEKPMALVSIKTQVDIIDGKGTRGGRPVTDLLDEVSALVQNGRSSIGILSHQLVHDELAWQFLEQFFAATSLHAGARWLPVSELMHHSA